MKNIGKLIHFLVLMPFVLSIFLMDSVSAQLSGDAQTDLLRQQVERQLRDEEWVEAVVTIQQLEKKAGKLEIDFSFFKGKALVEAGMGELAIEPLNHYVNTVGRSGRGYQIALKLYAKAQAQIKNTQHLTTKSGVKYEVFSFGSGGKPGAQDIVTANVSVSLPNGEILVDTGSQSRQKMNFHVDIMDKEMREVLQSMPVGSKFKYTMSAPNEVPGVPLNSPLFWWVEVLSIK